MKQILLMCCVIFTSIRLNSQVLYKSLQIGDTLPDIILENVLNYPGGKARISDFKGKLLILDFWNLGCAPCISAFPKMEKMQTQFADKVQILLVNVFNSYENLKRAGFPKNTKSPIIPKISLPFVVDSKELAAFFPHDGEPYHIWLDGNRKIVATTSAYATSPQNISDFLNGKELKLPIQLYSGDVLISRYKPFFSSQTGLLSKVIFDNLKYCSIITRRIQLGDLFSGGIYDSVSGKMTGFRINGFGPIHMFKTALGADFLIEFPDRVVLQVDDPEKYIQPPSKDPDKRANWEFENQLFYELSIPITQLSHLSDKDAELTIRRYVQNDLERYFGVEVKIRKQRIKCRALVRIDDYNRIKSKEIGNYYNEKDEDDKIIMKNCPFKIFFNKLRYALIDSDTKPLLDLTNFPGDMKIDLELKMPIANFKEIKKELNNHGLDLIEMERELEIMLIKKKVFSEKNKNSLQ